MKALFGKRSYEEIFFSASMAVAAIVFVVIYAYLYLNLIFIVSPQVFATLIIMGTVIPAFLASFTGLYIQRGDSEIFEGLELLFLAVTSSIALSFVFGILGYLFSILLSHAFQGIIYSNIGVSALTAAVAGLAAYFTASFVHEINQKKMAALILITFIFGFMLTAVRNNDHYWWASSLCALGMPVNQTPLYYSFTMIITGALMLTFGDFLKPQIVKLTKAGVLAHDEPLVLTILYGIGALNLFLVGIIPYGLNETLNQMHIFFANYTFIHVGVVILFGFLLFKKFPRVFMIQNYIILALTAAFYYFTVSRYVMPYALSEIVVIIDTIIWFTLFTRALKQLSESV